MYLRLEQLTRSFGERIAVRDLSLEVERGQLVCLLGPSGCGKTTTLKMIGGFLLPDAGRILVDGQEITRLAPERRPVATVFQSYALFPHLNVLQNVIYGLRFRPGTRAEARAKGLEYLKLAGLEEYADARVQELSGGQQQRVALVRALIVNPKVLLLDEPLSNLDAGLRATLRDELKEMKRRFDMTMVFVTHDQEEAMVLADRIAILKDGVLQQAGTPEEVYRRPANAFTMEFLGLTNHLTLGGQTVALRPEQFSVTPDGPLTGTVVQRDFFGFYERYQVRIGGETVLLRLPCGHGYAPGDTIRLAITEGPGD